jgi:hypothetical protein
MTNQFPGATKMVLSPAAQAVLDAFLAEWLDEDLDQDRCCLAAALRAAADEIVDAHDGFTGTRIHASIFAIAAELENQP